jgi:hypothetical protein
MPAERMSMRQMREGVRLKFLMVWRSETERRAMKASRVSDAQRAFIVVDVDRRGVKLEIGVQHGPDMHPHLCEPCKPCAAALSYAKIAKRQLPFTCSEP